MAEITGQQGASLTNELAQYLQNADGLVSSEEIAGIVNEYLSGGDQLEASGISAATGIYKRFNQFDLITGKVEVVTTGLWSGDTGSLTSFYTSSQSASSSGDYYYNVFNDTAGANLQFAVAYGHKHGSGIVSDPIAPAAGIVAGRAFYFDHFRAQISKEIHTLHSHLHLDWDTIQKISL